MIFPGDSLLRFVFVSWLWSAYEWNATSNSFVSLLTKKSMKSAGNVRSGHREKKTARKGGQSKLRNKNNARRLYPKRSFKETAIFRCFAVCATNSLLLCVGKRDLNKMWKSRSLTKVCNILQHSAGGLSDCDTLFY